MVSGLSLLLAVSACSRQSLHADAAASLIGRYRADHCRIVEISAQPGDVGARNAAGTVLALLRGLRIDRKVRTVVESSFGNFRTESLTLRAGGETEKAELSEMHYPGKPESDTVVVRACIFVPTQIEISDIVFESPSTANVLFTERLGLSLWGRSADRAQLLARMTGTAPSEAHAFHLRMATLRLYAGRWAVTSVGVNS